MVPEYKSPILDALDLVKRRKNVPEELLQAAIDEVRGVLDTHRTVPDRNPPPSHEPLPDSYEPKPTRENEYDF